MWEASFLKFDGVSPSLHLTKELTIDDVFQELFQVDLEDTGCDVWPIVGLLSRIQIVLNLLPVWVAGEGDEEVRFSFLDNNSHCIVVSLSHVPLTSLEGRRKNYLSTNVSAPFVSLSFKICLEFAVVLNLHFFLVKADVGEIACFYCKVGSDEVLLKQSSSKMQRIETISSDVFDVFLDYFLLLPELTRKSLLPNSKFVEKIESKGQPVILLFLRL